MFDKSVLDLISSESKEKYLAELEEKYIGAVINVNNINQMISDFEEENEILTREQIEELEKGSEQNSAKNVFMAYDWLKQQLKDNQQAVEIHKKSILFIK